MLLLYAPGPPRALGVLVVIIAGMGGLSLGWVIVGSRSWYLCTYARVRE